MTALLLAALCAQAEPAPSFINEVIPVLTRMGCNRGGCHGKEAGQNGFRLSLRGFSPEEDYERMVVESFGRRLSPSAPASSLLLLKPSGAMPHKGGVALPRESRAYGVLLRWIEAGFPGPRAGDRTLDGLQLSGGGELAPGASVPLQVTARWSDGREEDVTWLAQFFSNDPAILEVDGEGRVRARRVGAATVRAHFQDRVAVASFAVPRDGAVDPSRFAERFNEIDRHVFDRLAALRLPPSGPASDEEFLRRAFLDTIGTLPTPAEVEAFLADRAADKRVRLVDALLERPEFVDFWAQILGDLLQNRKERDHDVRGVKGVRSLHQWLRRQLAEHRSWDRIAREVLTARGSVDEQPAVGYWIVTVGETREADRSEAVASVAQTFLGTRILCAKCHNHPEERFTQDDYTHFAAFFASVSLDRQKPESAFTTLEVMSSEEREERRRIAEAEKAVARLEAGASDEARRKIVEREKEIAQARRRIEEIRRKPPRSTQPRTRKPLEPQPLDRTALTLEAGRDPREALADWMIASPTFSGAIVNRLWKHFMGAGLVEPVDDLRPSNPPSNGPLWEHLTADFVRGGFDLRRLMRQILTSRAYQLSSATLPENAPDRRFTSHTLPRRIPAEALLDAICQATGVPENFPGHPSGIRAIALPDPLVDVPFLRMFGRPDRVTACACERSGEVTLPQLLHLQNGRTLSEKIGSPEGRLARLLQATPDTDAIVTELFLATLSRPPRDTERAAVRKALEGGADRTEVLQDLFWSLLNSKEFVFIH